MNEGEFSEHIKEILRRVRSGEERIYSMEEVRIMLGIEGDHDDNDNDESDKGITGWR